MTVTRKYRVKLEAPSFPKPDYVYYAITGGFQYDSEAGVLRDTCITTLGKKYYEENNENVIINVDYQGVQGPRIANLGHKVQFGGYIHYKAYYADDPETEIYDYGNYNAWVEAEMR